MLATKLPPLLSRKQKRRTSVPPGRAFSTSRRFGRLPVVVPADIQSPRPADITTDSDGKPLVASIARKRLQHALQPTINVVQPDDFFAATDGATLFVSQRMERLPITHPTILTPPQFEITLPDGRVLTVFVRQERLTVTRPKMFVPQSADFTPLPDGVFSLVSVRNRSFPVQQAAIVIPESLIIPLTVAGGKFRIPVNRPGFAICENKPGFGIDPNRPGITAPENDDEC